VSLEDALRSIVRDELERAFENYVPARDSLPPKWLTMTALAEQLSVSVPTLKGLIEKGLPYIQPGEHKRFNLADCEAWLREQRDRGGRA